MLLWLRSENMSFCKLIKREDKSMYCENCGAKIDDGAKFCPSCGAPVGPDTQNQYGYTDENGHYGGYPQEDSQHGMGIVAYITWIGWIVAIATTGGRPRSEFVRFHINQALVINLFALLTFIPLVGWIWGIIMFVFWIMGLVSACTGTMKRVPLIGGIDIIRS